MITDKMKAEWFDTIIDNYCELYGVRECVQMLTQCELTNEQFIELGFSQDSLPQ